MHKRHKAIKLQERKELIRAAVQKKKDKRNNRNSLAISDDYYNELKSYSYEDVTDLLSLPKSFAGYSK